VSILASIVAPGCSGWFTGRRCRPVCAFTPTPAWAALPDVRKQVGLDTGLWRGKRTRELFITQEAAANHGWNRCRPGRPPRILAGVGLAGSLLVSKIGFHIHACRHGRNPMADFDQVDVTVTADGARVLARKLHDAHDQLDQVLGEGRVIELLRSRPRSVSVAL